MDKNMDWIYRPINEPDLESILAEVEKALGFKLFVWQKTFIATGVFRQYGATTAEILRELLAVDARPLDYTTRPGSHKGAFYREELLKIKGLLPFHSWAAVRSAWIVAKRILQIPGNSILTFPKITEKS